MATPSPAPTLDNSISTYSGATGSEYQRLLRDIEAVLTTMEQLDAELAACTEDITALSAIMAPGDDVRGWWATAP